MYKMYSIMFALYILRDVICYWISVKTLNKYMENRESWSLSVILESGYLKPVSSIHDNVRGNMFFFNHKKKIFFIENTKKAFF